MKKYMYIIVLNGERGTYHAVRKVFETKEKAYSYATNNCSYIMHGIGEPTEKVISKAITKVEVV